MIENAAIFLGRTRIYRGVNVEDAGTEIALFNRIGNEEIARYSVVEVGKAGMAWDVLVDGETKRLVAQQGCGCSGMKKYENDAEYTGTFPGHPR